jgi:hypothetical protein
VTIDVPQWPNAEHLVSLDVVPPFQRYRGRKTKKADYKKCRRLVTREPHVALVRSNALSVWTQREPLLVTRGDDLTAQLDG